MNKRVSLYLAQKDIPTWIDVVQGATLPAITFVLEDFTPHPGAQCQIFIKKQNSEVYNTCTLDGNEITFEPTTGSFDEVGVCVAQLEIMTGDQALISFRIWVKVEPNIIDTEAIEASDDFSALQDAIAAIGDLTELRAQVNQNTADIANKSDFSSGINVNGNVSLTKKNAYLRVLDKTGYDYPLIGDNGTNLWIGSSATATQHHAGGTYISAGYDTANSAGFKSVQIAVPNATNTNATNSYVFHERYLDVSKATDGLLSRARGGTGISNIFSVGAGSYNGGTQIADKSVADSTWTNLGSFTLEKGLYLVCINVSWNANATGRRSIILTDSATSSSPKYNMNIDTRNAVSGAKTPTIMSHPLRITAATETWYLNAFQNSGSALTASTRFQVLKLADI